MTTRPRRVKDVPGAAALLAELDLEWADTILQGGRRRPAIRVGGRLKPIEEATRAEIIEAAEKHRKSAQLWREHADAHDRTAVELGDLARKLRPFFLVPEEPFGHGEGPDAAE